MQSTVVTLMSPGQLTASYQQYSIEEQRLDLRGTSRTAFRIRVAPASRFLANHMTLGQGRTDGQPSPLRQSWSTDWKRSSSASVDGRRRRKRKRKRKMLVMVTLMLVSTPS